MQIIPVGTKVAIVVPDGENISGSIVAVKIADSRGFAITYEVAWWSSRSRYTEWFSAEVLQIGDLPIQTIGFVRERSTHDR